VRRGVRRLATQAAPLLDQGNVSPGLLQQVSGSNACDAGANDQHVDGNVFF
jgi:hypothetical protein